MSLSLAEASWVNIYLIPRGLSHQTKVRCKEGGCVGDSVWLRPDVATGPEQMEAEDPGCDHFSS